jgi:DNA-directed RNA polymerase subunit H (RpoH/RPB5)
MYENTLSFAKMRNFTPLDPVINLKEFRNIIQLNQYIESKYTNENKVSVHIYIFDEEGAYIKETENFKRILSKLGKTKPRIAIFITNKPLTIYIRKKIHLYSNVKVFNYFHHMFYRVLPDMPQSPKHRIMSRKEIIYICGEIFHKLPSTFQKIDVMDPQAVWIGAEVGDMIEVQGHNRLVGTYIKYRTVVDNSTEIKTNMKEKSRRIMGGFEDVKEEEYEEEDDEEEEDGVYSDNDDYRFSDVSDIEDFEESEDDSMRLIGEKLEKNEESD